MCPKIFKLYKIIIVLSLFVGSVVFAQVKPSSLNEAEGDIAIAEAQALLKAENEIPVLTAEPKKANADSGSLFKIIMTIAVIGVLGASAVLFMRRHAQKANTPSSLMQIKILTQHHLGPKKSLAVVRVAGESILIGITDQNISMIKALSLLDEELPEVTPNDFKQVMETTSPKTQAAGFASAAKVQDGEEFGFMGIRDVVSEKIRNMRKIQ